MPIPPNAVEQRVAVALAVGRYLRAADRFQAASSEFTETCDALRSHLSEPCRFITQVDYRHYLVTADRDGNFEVEQIQSL